MILKQLSRIKILRIQLLLLGGLLLTILLVSTALGAPEEPADPETIVRCDPVDSAVALGATFHFDIYIQNVENLGGADVRLAYDPSIVTAVDANPAVGGVQMELLDVFLYPDFVLRNVIDPSAGTIWYAAVQVSTPERPRDPANGSGPLARVTFEAVKEGSFEMPITYALLSTPEGSEIPYTAVNCSVTVVAGGDQETIYLPVVLSP